jgi:hypothetical protein
LIKRKLTKKNQEQTIALALCFFLNGQPLRLAASLNFHFFITYFFCLDTEKVTKRNQEIAKAIFRKL